MAVISTRQKVVRSVPLALQVARLQREVEGLEEQRARAREDAKRSEAARQQLDMEIKVPVNVELRLQMAVSFSASHLPASLATLLQLRMPLMFIKSGDLVHKLLLVT